ncbi:MAG: ABC transporter permease [Prolixibacteraceae bacterium]|nr:ABC transporter permease [Prolixibacteraceae bacterium]MBN2650387.1 ABC transporter permease [Prolixibacteraceae bacterium]
MNKIWIIFKREYLTRVKKKSFLILTILTPLLFAGIMFVPGYLATRESQEEHKVAVCDRSAIFLGELKDSKSTCFYFIPEDEFNNIKENLKTNEYYALLDIPQNVLNSKRVIVYSHKQVNLDVKNHIDRQIERLLEDKQRAELVERVGIPDLEEQLQATKTNISVETFKMGDDGVGKKGSTEIAMGVGYAAGFLIYMFVFIYGSMVMRGVTEEKQNRIVEVIISSAKPVQLMMGKIIGLAAVGLTQFLIWIILVGGIILGAQSMVSTEDSSQTLENQSVMMTDNPVAAQVMDNMDADNIEQLLEKFLEILEGIDFTQIIVFFLIYFLLGYLLYSSLMAAVASAVDSEEDMNQFMLPITVPLIGAIIILANVIKNPEGSLAFWASHIPFTSPIIMMVRIPFGVPWYEILISISILAASTFGAIWMAAKIYRTGILMYGKKPSWKELGKWLSYRN